MLRILWCLTLSLVLGLAHANPAVITMITPSPLGVILTVGHWIVTKDNRRLYYIEVEGRGATAVQARDNGFRLAVEQALGTLISSETEVVNGRIQRDEIISYASGFVDRFEIIDADLVPDGQGHLQGRTRMRVWVSRSSLSDRLLNRSAQSGQVDGARASVQLQTLNQERATGDALLQQVLTDFPRRAFDIELRPTDIIRQNRSAQMELEFSLKWNQDYLRSLWTALEATAYRGSNPVSVIGVNSGSMFGFGGQARFDDTFKYEQLIRTMVISEPSVLLTLRGDGGILHQACYHWPELDNQARYSGDTGRRFVQLNTYKPYVFLDGGYRMRGRIQVPITSETLKRATAVDLDIIPQKQCPK